MSKFRYDRGVIFGLEEYARQSQACRTFDAPRMTGYLSACVDDSPHSRGVLHGIALGAKMQHDRMMQTLELRAAS